jgi:hypothetical protein
VVSATQVEYTSFSLMQRRFFGTGAKGANISSTEMTVFDLLKSADHAKFKQIAKMTCAVPQGAGAEAEKQKRRGFTRRSNSESMV